MPNHITNELKFNLPLDEFKKIQDHMYTDENTPFDFNKLIPMPNSLNIEASSELENMAHFLFNLKTGCPPSIKSMQDYFKTNTKSHILDVINKAFQYYENYNQYGCTTWYEWRYKHWHTKWNAYNVDIQPNLITFQTAWSGVLNLMLELSKKLNTKFEYSFTDENIGYNCATCIIENGNIISEHVPENGSKEAYELAFRLNPDAQKYYKLVNDKYIHIED
jgi:hypothetical protein